MRSKTVIVLLLALFTFGCGGTDGPEIATVHGTVTMDGRPLAGAAVVFYPENGRPGAGETDENGNYTLSFSEGREGAIPGRNIVRISTAKGEVEKEDGTTTPATPETVPAEYNIQTTLEFVVEAGEDNVADFPLVSGGDVVESSFDDNGE